MVKVKWKLERKKVYLEVHHNNCIDYYWFFKDGIHKRFHPRQIFTRRNINFKGHKDSLIPYYTDRVGWIVGELKDEIVTEKLGIKILTELEYYEQLSKAC